MKNMKVSIALCTYNGEKYLEEQLESYTCQTVMPFELVVCDDCSRDRTIDILKEFKKNAGFEVHIHRNDTNLGSTKNFEKAINLCSGEIISLSDQDDVWMPDKVINTLEAFSREPEAGAVFSDAYIVGEDLNDLGYSLWESFRFDGKKKEKFLKGRPHSVLIVNNVVTGATMSFKGAYRDKFNPIPREWIHDFWISFIIGAFSKIVFVEKKLIKYRQHASQQIGGLKNDKLLVKEALRNNSGDYKRDLDFYRIAFDRLEALHRQNPEIGDALGIVSDGIRFKSWRANMPENKLKRIPHIFDNIINLRYYNYANGVISAFKDLLLN